MNTQQAYIEGFIKRAGEYGVSQEKALELKKTAEGVKSFAPRKEYPLNLTDIAGTVLLGHHYIPAPQENESILDSRLRASRGAELAGMQAKVIGDNPLLLLMGNPSKAMLDLHQMRNNPDIMRQFDQKLYKESAARKDWWSIPEHVRKAIIAAKKGVPQAKEHLGDIASAGGRAAAKQNRIKKLRDLINRGEELPPSTPST